MVLLIIDTQNAIINNELYQRELFIRNVKALIETARQNQVEVIYVRHDDGEGCELTKGKTGFEIYDEFLPNSQERIFDKTVNSAFRNTGLLEYLREKKEKQIIMAGLQTDYCMDASVKCAFEHGFHVIVPAYANTTVENQFMSSEDTYRYYNEFIWNRRYAECVSVSDAVALMQNMHER